VLQAQQDLEHREPGRRAHRFQQFNQPLERDLRVAARPPHPVVPPPPYPPPPRGAPPPPRPGRAE
ncbi:hypothetical protein, partial [Nocardia cyriacigeorgica]|uniref:hypothetical protein n=1 Tax=Nocardia cyriacigeorgica TaxID=135487 RepID=UPI0024553E84